MKSSTAKSVGQSGPVRDGDIHSNTIPYLIHDLVAQRATGLLTVSDGELKKTLWLRDGGLQFASSNQRDDRLSAMLMRHDVLPLKSLMKALEVMLSTKDRLGEVMVQWKLMTAKDVEKWVGAQVREIAYSIFHWTRGKFAFEFRDLPAETITVGDSGHRIVFEGVKRLNSWVRAYEELGSLATEFLATKEAPALARELQLTNDEKQLLDLCAEQPMTLEELCDDSRLKDFDVCKAVWAFLIVGALMKS
ncbi:MAG: DUF4388 domain-containing protein [Candidatus Polarisedimenticolia bacterium]